MAISKTWLTLPSTDLTNKKNWRELGNGHFYALRANILIVRSANGKSRLGLPVQELDIQGENSYQFEWGVRKHTSRTDTISDAIRFSTTERVMDQVTGKLGSKLKAGLPGLSAEVAAEIFARTDHEVASTTERVLTGISSFLTEQEITEKITLTLKANPKLTTIRQRYSAYRWDCYLHSFEFLEIYSYEPPSIFGKGFRHQGKVMKYDAKWPLVSIAFHEPQRAPDVTYDEVVDPLEEPQAIEVFKLDVAMPGARVEQPLSLEELAKLAFPVDKAEVRAAKQEREKAERSKIALHRGNAVRKTPAKKAAAKKAPAKKAPAKKAPMKRMSPVRRGVR